jgi:hypothetical protein
LCVATEATAPLVERETPTGGLGAEPKSTASSIAFVGAEQIPASPISTICLASIVGAHFCLGHALTLAGVLVSIQTQASASSAATVATAATAALIHLIHFVHRRRRLGLGLLLLPPPLLPLLPLL